MQATAIKERGHRKYSVYLQTGQYLLIICFFYFQRHGLFNLVNDSRKGDCLNSIYNGRYVAIKTWTVRKTTDFSLNLRENEDILLACSISISAIQLMLLRWKNTTSHCSLRVRITLWQFNRWNVMVRGQITWQFVVMSSVLSYRLFHKWCYRKQQLQFK